MRKRVIFTGRVQGVGFRATARSIARAHPVTGWVKNEPDGSVLMEVQGSESAIGRYLDGIRGDLGRYLRGMEEMVVAEREGESGFEITY